MPRLVAGRGQGGVQSVGVEWESEAGEGAGREGSGECNLH